MFVVLAAANMLTTLAADAATWLTNQITEMQSYKQGVRVLTFLANSQTQVLECDTVLIVFVLFSMVFVDFH